MLGGVNMFSQIEIWIDLKDAAQSDLNLSDVPVDSREKTRQVDCERKGTDDSTNRPLALADSCLH
jgi:hypothetical protein